MTKNTRVSELLVRAKNCKNKGRWYVYEQYKQELSKLGLTPAEYEQTCRKLARYLEV